MRARRGLHDLAFPVLYVVFWGNRSWTATTVVLDDGFMASMRTVDRLSGSTYGCLTCPVKLKAHEESAAAVVPASRSV